MSAAPLTASEAGRSPGDGTGSGRRRRGRRAAAEARAGILLSLPFVVLFTVFIAWPVLQSMFMSFTDMRISDIRSPFSVNFVGLENYLTAFEDPVFRRAALNTGVFVLIGVPLTIIAYSPPRSP